MIDVQLKQGCGFVNIVDLAQMLVLDTKLCFSPNKLVITLLYGLGTSLVYFTVKPLHSKGYMYVLHNYYV